MKRASASVCGVLFMYTMIEGIYTRTEGSGDRGERKEEEYEDIFRQRKLDQYDGDSRFVK